MRRHLVRALNQHLAGGRLQIPEFGMRAWLWFLDLHNTRTYGDVGPNPISFAEIDAYMRLMRWEPSPEHIATIRALDEAWLTHVRQGPGKTKSRKPTGAISPALFDAVFA